MKKPMNDINTDENAFGVVDQPSQPAPEEQTQEVSEAQVAAILGKPVPAKKRARKTTANTKPKLEEVVPEANAEETPADAPANGPLTNSEAKGGDTVKKAEIKLEEVKDNGEEHMQAVQLDSAHEDAPEDDTPLLKVVNLKEWFPIKTSIDKRKNVYLKAVDGVSFELRQARR